MDYSIKNGTIDKLKSDCLIVGAYTKGLTPSAAKLDKQVNGFISKALKQAQFESATGETHILHMPEGAHSPLVIIVGCGDGKQINDITHQKIVKGALSALKALKVKKCVSALSEIDCQKRSTAWKVADFILRSADVFYQYDALKSKSTSAKLPLTTFLVAKKDVEACEAAAKINTAITRGMHLTKDLGNAPANVCTPSYLAKEAKALAKKYPKMNAAVLSEKDMQDLKMGSLLSVTQGSVTPAKLITMEYRGGKKNDAPYVLVGKGITFDTGGNSLKPAGSMIGMKYDMCGGASVFGILQAVAECNLPLNVIGVVPACENTPGGAATRPDDIVKSMSGQTIEILNTDAEGRLILADALTYVERYKPKYVIDMATLTGACVVALGNLATAVLSNHQDLADKLLQASQDIFDRAWQLPLWEDYHEQLKSPFADMKNIGDGGAGTITAGCFLEKFAQNYPWAHLDIAGSAAQFSGPNRGASGRPVPMMVQFLVNEAQ